MAASWRSAMRRSMTWGTGGGDAAILPGRVHDWFRSVTGLAPSPAVLPPMAADAAKVPAAKKILVLSVSAGSGHLRAAEAICASAHEHGGVAATHLDVMDFVPAGFRKLYTDFYIALVNRHPALWGYLYHASHEAKSDGRLQRLRRAIERMNTMALRREIATLAPDAIVCTHFLPAEILARVIEKKGIACPVWVQVTDFDLHRMWVQPRMAGYFAASEEVAYRMRAQGIAADAIHVTGIPIMPTFAKMPRRADCAREFGLDPERTTVLLMGGGAGVGSLDAVAERLLDIGADFQLIALAGRNAEVLARLRQLAARHPGHLLAQGYTEHVDRLMACADFAISKPGGLTTAECLAMGLPMIVNTPIPGQEERNADFLLEQGVALKASDMVTLAYRVRQLLDDPAKLAGMRARASALGRPQAARQVLERVLMQDGPA